MDALDRLFLERCYELAERGIGNTSPNPPVGAVIVRDGAVAGEGYHHRAGEPHAEVLALRQAADMARGATLYVSLEPCNHHGKTPPCSQAVAEAGIVRVVIGASDPNPITAAGGMQFLRDRGIEIELLREERALAVIEPFARAIRSDRPYVTLKMAMSLDGYVAARGGEQEWLTGEESRAFVRDLRIAHDAVIVGAGTVRVDNPQLTVRPPHHRLREYVRVVACETDAVDPQSAVFEQREGYGKTIVLAPAGARRRFSQLEDLADLAFVGAEADTHLDIAQAFRTLRSRGIASVLCEGGPTMAGHLFALGLVDRFCWLVAPRLLSSPNAVPVLARAQFAQAPGLRFDRVERLGADLLISGVVDASV